jgi:hypothetical protein
MRARRFLAAAFGMVALVGMQDRAVASTPSVRGSGTIVLPAAYGDLAGDTVVFRLHAQSDGTTRGRFNVVHRDDAGGLYGHVIGDITCVSGSEGVVATTGVIRHAWFRDFPGSAVLGMAAAITVADDGPGDLLGFDFEFFDSNIVPCAAVPAAIPVQRGNFVVH